MRAWILVQKKKPGVVATPTSRFSVELFADAYPPGIENNYWNLARNWVIHRTLANAERMGLHSHSSPILEIGCGPGIVLDYLLRHGFNIRGVELGESPSISRVSDWIKTGTRAQELSQEDRVRVQTILLLDVIEHIENDREFLRSIRSAFPNCRCAIVAVPARPEAWSDWDEHFGHYRRYTVASLRDSLCEIGPCVHVRYFFRSLYVIARLMSAFGFRRKIQLKPPSNPWLHQIFAGALKAETLLTPRSLPGLSLIAICAVR